DERVCLLLVSQHNVRMVIPALNRDDAAARTSIDLVAWADADGPNEALHKALSGATAPRSLAVDGLMRADFLISLQQNVAAGKTIAADTLLAPLRERKSPQEVEALARAAAQADRAMQAGIDACKPGVTEASVAWAVESAFRLDGAEIADFALIASGPNGAFPHHHAGERRLAKGDAIILDIGGTLDGFKSDITRMVHLGKPSDEFLQTYAAVLKANETARAAVRPGATTGAIDHAARSTLQSAGYGEYFTHRTGHGIGLEVHERPWIMADNPAVLAEGMAFSVEPGVYLVNRFGVRIEDIVVVTASGVRTLTGFDHSLVVKD
ncbi:MAG: M24 family metallopeptidase, partial [Chloroflexi bacterium]|nr:M24 family metallopeptidase [Chloroflexota bacterium]